MRCGEVLQRLDGSQQLRNGEGSGDAGGHAPEITVAVKAPPVPLEHVGRGVAAPQSGDDPLHNIAH